jgi:hypothetical protein
MCCSNESDVGFLEMPELNYCLLEEVQFGKKKMGITG